MHKFDNLFKNSQETFEAFEEIVRNIIILLKTIKNPLNLFFVPQSL